MKKIFFQIVDKILSWHQFYKHEVIREKYGICKSFGFNGKDIKFYGEGRIEIGDKSYICNNSLVYVDKGYKVKIGNGCSISHNVKMYTASKIPDYDFQDKINVPEKKGDIIIGDYVWIGVNVVINPGVTIGDNAVVGANSVVTSNLKPYGIYGGVPARLIRMKNIA